MRRTSNDLLRSSLDQPFLAAASPGSKKHRSILTYVVGNDPATDQECPQGGLCARREHCKPWQLRAVAACMCTAEKRFRPIANRMMSVTAAGPERILVRMGSMPPTFPLQTFTSSVFSYTSYTLPTYIPSLPLCFPTLLTHFLKTPSHHLQPVPPWPHRSNASSTLQVLPLTRSNKTPTSKPPQNQCHQN